MDEHDEVIRRARQLEAESRAEFERAHHDGLLAIEQHDHQALTRAIAGEAEAIEKHSEALDRLKAAIGRSSSSSREREGEQSPQ